MEALKNLLQRIPVPLLVIVVALYYAWDFYSFQTAEDSPLKAKQADIVTAETQLTAAQNKLKQLEKFQAENELIKGEVRALAQRLEDLRANLSDRFDEGVFIATVQREAQRSLGGLKSIRAVGTPVVQNFYVEHKFDVEVQGLYWQILVLLKRLASNPTLINVESLVLAPTTEKIQKKTKIDMKIVLKGYRYSPSDADKKAQALRGGA